MCEKICMRLDKILYYFYLKYKPVFSTLVLAFLLFITFFFSNYLVAIPLLISMAIAFFIFDDKKRAFSFFVKSLPLVFLFVFGWFLLFNDPGIVTGNASILRNIHPSSFGRIIILYFKDYNLSQLLPYGMIILLVLLWLKDGIFNSFEKFMNKRKELAIIVTIVLFTIILSIISPQYSHAANSDIRHATAIFPFLLLVQSFAIMRIYDWRKWAGILLIFVAVWTNLFTFMPYRSFLYEYVRENLHPFDNSVKQSVKFLREKVHQEDTILVSPNHMVGTMEFYLEDKLLFCGVVPPQYKNATVRGRNIPDYAVGCEYNPDWVVLFGLKADQPHTYEQLKKLNLS